MPRALGASGGASPQGAHSLSRNTGPCPGQGAKALCSQRYSCAPRDRVNRAANPGEGDQEDKDGGNSVESSRQASDRLFGAFGFEGLEA